MNRQWGYRRRNDENEEDLQENDVKQDEEGK